MRVAATTGVFNEQRNIATMIERVMGQTRVPDEFIIVDDGSTDKTAEIIKEYAVKYPVIRYFYQKNAGPAAARNRAWKNSGADICVFTDGDCVPEPDWIEELLKPFADERVGATAGTYRTMNVKHILARFIGLEIAWKYKDISGQVDVHGTYNLAVRKNVLEEVGGLDETYPKASGEDWDMTYKISRRHKIMYVPQAVVGHYHPERFWPYMKNQVRRGFDRVKVYRDHPELKKGDAYTPWYVKYQVLGSGALIPSLIFIFPVFPLSYMIPLIIVIFLLSTALLPFIYFGERDISVAFYSVPVQIARSFAWFWGMAKGISHQITKNE